MKNSIYILTKFFSSTLFEVKLCASYFKKNSSDYIIAFAADRSDVFIYTATSLPLYKTGHSFFLIDGPIY